MLLVQQDAKLNPASGNGENDTISSFDANSVEADSEIQLFIAGLRGLGVSPSVPNLNDCRNQANADSDSSGEQQCALRIRRT